MVEMSNTTTSHEDQETYQYSYYVQSPNTITNVVEYSPTRSDSTFPSNHQPPSHYTPSCYFSSPVSNNSFSNAKKTIKNGLIIVDHDTDEDEDEDEYYRKKGYWWVYCSFRKSSSCVWVILQLSWRFLLSLGVALLVFYISTKPPPPNISIKMAGIPEFLLGEGVDTTGVPTKILTFNCSMHLLVDNNSKLFGLHIHPPTMEISFSHLHLATSHGTELYVESQGSSAFKLYVGTKNKAMYGGGRNMEDMLNSKNGLPLVISVSLSSTFQMIGKLINSKFHHKTTCFVLLTRSYEKKKYTTQEYRGRCNTTMSIS